MIVKATHRYINQTLVAILFILSILSAALPPPRRVSTDFLDSDRTNRIDRMWIRRGFRA